MNQRRKYIKFLTNLGYFNKRTNEQNINNQNKSYSELPNPNRIPLDRNNLSDQINLKSNKIDLNINISNLLEEENKKVSN